MCSSLFRYRCDEKIDFSLLISRHKLLVLTILRHLQTFSFTVTFIVKKHACKSLNEVTPTISVEVSAIANQFSRRNGIENVSNVSQSVRKIIINHQQHHLDVNKSQNPEFPSVAGIAPPGGLFCSRRTEFLGTPRTVWTPASPEQYLHTWESNVATSSVSAVTEVR